MKRKYNTAILILVFIMTFCMIISVQFSVKNINEISEQISIARIKTVTHLVSADIENYLLRSLTLSEFMSKNANLKAHLNLDTPFEQPHKKEIVRYLNSLQDGIDHKRIFIINDKSKAYYTFNGIEKFINEELDPHDAWFTSYKEEKHNLILLIDSEKVSPWDLSVFVNRTLYDDNGDFLGICGVDLQMSKIQEILKTQQIENRIKIYLVDKNGKILISEDKASIHNEYFENTNIEKLDTTNYFCDLTQKRIQTTSYIPKLDWYLIIVDDNPKKIDVKRIVTPTVIIFLVGTVLMLAIFIIMSIMEYRLRKISLYDKLTNLFNRHAYEIDCKEAEKSSLKDLALIALDINGLKQVNDSLGHKAGDELIKGASQALQHAFSNKGNIYRIGGDEFIVITKSCKENTQECITKLEDFIVQWNETNLLKLSVSKAVVFSCDFPTFTFDELQELADQEMYKDKSKYYDKAKNDRRQSRR